jgi:hypothetical protein
MTARVPQRRRPLARRIQLTPTQVARPPFPLKTSYATGTTAATSHLFLWSFGARGRSTPSAAADDKRGVSSDDGIATVFAVAERLTGVVNNAGAGSDPGRVVRLSHWRRS